MKHHLVLNKSVSNLMLKVWIRPKPFNLHQHFVFHFSHLFALYLYYYYYSLYTVWSFSLRGLEVYGQGQKMAWEADDRELEKEIKQCIYLLLLYQLVHFMKCLPYFLKNNKRSHRNQYIFSTLLGQQSPKP